MIITGWQALRWNYLGNLARGCSQFLIGVVLARLLGPEPFGILALAWMIVGLGRLVADLGFGAALVQRATLSETDLRYVFTVQMGFALLLTTAGWLSAETIANYFHKPEATPVLRALFFLFIIDCPGQTAASLLRRGLDFKRVQQVAIASYLIGYVLVGLPCAWLGYGVWSLVAAQLTQSLLSTGLLLHGTPLPMKPCWRADTPGITGFGAKVTAANLSSWAISNLDTAFVGRAFGAAELGLYSRALSLLNMPMSLIATGFQGVLFAACSRHQHDTGKLRSIYLESSTAVAMISVPLFITAAAVPATLVLGVYGSKWQASIALVPPLALAILINVLLAIQGPILMAGNRVGAELRSQAYTVLIFLPLLWIASMHVLVWTAWAVFATYVLRWVLLTAAALRLTGTRVQDYARCLCFPVLFGTAVAAAAFAVDFCLDSVPALPRLLAVAAAAASLSLLLAQQFGAAFLASNMRSLVSVDSLSLPIKRFLNI
jgi:O-antigen/teichoic acid export membrane protein